MSQSINVRTANNDDSKDIARLLTILGYPVSEEFVLFRLDLLRRTGMTEIFVAELEEAVVGVMSFEVAPLFHQEGNIGCITSLSVEPEVRSRGIGTALVRAGEQFAIDQSCIKISVASGLHRTEAHDFYRKLGYEENTKRFVKVLRR